MDKKRAKRGPAVDVEDLDVEALARELLDRHGGGVRRYLAEQIWIARGLRDGLSVAIWRELAAAVSRLRGVAKDVRIEGGIRTLYFVLVVDDDPQIRYVLALALERPGITIFTAVDSFEAKRILAERPVDLIVADIGLPKVNGFEFARQAKVMRPKLQFIFITGWPEKEIPEKPVDGTLLLKPFRPDRLVEVVQRELGITP